MNIENLRKEIDFIDDKILALLLKRMELCKKIGKIKKERGVKIEDLRREHEILERIKKAAEVNSPAAESIFKNIIQNCKNIQQ